MRQILAAGAVLAASLLLCLAPAEAQWTMGQRSKFVADCIPGCERNPNVPDAQKAQCGVFCDCIATESERVITSAELQEMEVEAAAGRDHPSVAKFRTVAPVCNSKAFGN